MQEIFMQKGKIGGGGDFSEIPLFFSENLYYNRITVNRRARRGRI